jgi:aspartate-semialdehyde dehydrogenase
LAKRPTVALVGSESLLGRDVRDLVTTSDPGFDLRLVAADDQESGKLTRLGDEPALIEMLAADSLDGVGAVILAGNQESNRKALELTGDAPVIDLDGVAEDRPDARLRAPLAENGEDPEEGESAAYVIAHPAAIALAIFLRRLQSIEPVRRAVIQVMAPASEWGTAGVTELQQQTVSLLSFKGMPKELFDAQLSFNLLARLGEEARVRLDELEQRIERHLATLLANPGPGVGAPMPSLRLVQAPVFHGYSFSAWVEFEANPGIGVLEEALAGPLIDVRGADLEPPNNVGHAGQSGISIGAIEPDRNDPEACWFWLVADNIRLVAENAIEVARQLV